MPRNVSAPIIMVGPGTGIAPFRGFWHHRKYQIENETLKQKPGPLWLFFGCRTKAVDLYRKEKEELAANSILYKNSLALSREKGTPKVNQMIILERK